MKNKKIYFIGIGGIGMSSIALHYHREGSKVLGSNINENERVVYLKSQGIPIFMGHREENLPDDVDLVIRTRAVREDNPEILAAKKRRFSVIERNDALIEITKNLKPSIGVTGTDGKTTTTSMIHHSLKKLGEKPYGFLGGIHKGFDDGNYSKGERGVVFELDESTPVFSKYEVTHLVITNARADHLENFKNDIRFYLRSFIDLVKKTEGIVVTFAEDELTGEMGKITFGVGSGDFVLVDREISGRSQIFTYKNPKGFYRKVRLSVPGFHNALDALATIALLTTMGYDERDVIRTLADFENVNRRFTISYSDPEKDIYVIDDYAHTPEEIKSLLTTVKEVFSRQKIVSVFQPHRYSRTLRENGRFAEVLKASDIVYVTDIYGAYEEGANVSAEDIVKNIKVNGGNAEYKPDLDELIENLNVEENTVYVFIGAGDIIEYSKKFVDFLGGSS